MARGGEQTGHLSAADRSSLGEFPSTLLRLNRHDPRVDAVHRARLRMLEALERIAREGLVAEPEALDALLRPRGFEPRHSASPS